ncbi:MAG: hypothetical protein QXW06_06475 [Thermoplasmata archaeon]
MMRRGQERRLLRIVGSVVLLLNVAVACLSLSDLCLLTSGAVRVTLPTEKDFSWRLDAGNASIVFLGSYTIQNRGFYDITDLNIDASISTPSGVRLVDYSVKNVRIPAFGGGNRTILAIMPLERLLGLDFGSILFSATKFVIKVRVDAAYILGLARFHAEETIDYSWRPPLREWAGYFLGGNLSAALRDAMPALGDLFDSLVSWVAAAILAGGEPVTLHSGGLETVLSYIEPFLYISLRAGGRELARVSLNLPAGGGGIAEI